MQIWNISHKGNGRMLTYLPCPTAMHTWAFKNWESSVVRVCAPLGVCGWCKFTEGAGFQLPLGSVSCLWKPSKILSICLGPWRPSALGSPHTGPPFTLLSSSPRFGLFSSAPTLPQGPLLNTWAQICYLSNTYLLSSYHVPRTGLGPWEQRGKESSLEEFSLWTRWTVTKMELLLLQKNHWEAI